MKVFKRLVLNNLNVAVEEFLDPFQFAYRAKRCVEKMLFYYVFNSVYAHTSTYQSSVHVLLLFFMAGKGREYFSNAFSVIQSHLLS